MKNALLLCLMLSAAPVIAGPLDAEVTTQAFASVDAGVPAIAAPVPAPVNPEENPVGVLLDIGNAVQNKAWGKLVFILVTLLVWVARKFLGEKVPFLKSDAGGVVMAFAVAFTGMLSTTWGAGQRPDLAAVLNAVVIAAAASGFWTWFKKLLLDKLMKPAAPAEPPVAP